MGKVSKRETPDSQGRKRTRPILQRACKQKPEIKKTGRRSAEAILLAENVQRFGSATLTLEPSLRSGRSRQRDDRVAPKKPQRSRKVKPPDVVKLEVDNDIPQNNPSEYVQVPTADLKMERQQPPIMARDTSDEDDPWVAFRDAPNPATVVLPFQDVSQPSTAADAGDDVGNHVTSGSQVFSLIKVKAEPVKNEHVPGLMNVDRDCASPSLPVVPFLEPIDLNWENMGMPYTPAMPVLSPYPCWTPSGDCTSKEMLGSQMIPVSEDVDLFDSLMPAVDEMESISKPEIGLSSAKLDMKVKPVCNCLEAQVEPQTFPLMQRHVDVCLESSMEAQPLSMSQPEIVDDRLDLLTETPPLIQPELEEPTDFTVDLDQNLDNELRDCQVEDPTSCDDAPMKTSVQDEDGKLMSPEDPPNVQHCSEALDWIDDISSSSDEDADETPLSDLLTDINVGKVEPAFVWKPSQKEEFSFDWILDYDEELPGDDPVTSFNKVNQWLKMDQPQIKQRPQHPLCSESDDDQSLCSWSDWVNEVNSEENDITNFFKFQDLGMQKGDGVSMNLIPEVKKIYEFDSTCRHLKTSFTRVRPGALVYAQIGQEDEDKTFYPCIIKGMGQEDKWLLTYSGHSKFSRDVTVRMDQILPLRILGVGIILEYTKVVTNGPFRITILGHQIASGISPDCDKPLRYRILCEYFDKNKVRCFRQWRNWDKITIPLGEAMGFKLLAQERAQLGVLHRDRRIL